MSKTRPILFSAPMVRALLEGSKTQTRRVVKPQHLKFFDQSPTDMLGAWSKRPMPYGQFGDRLWVREAWRTSKVADELKSSQLVGGGCSPIWHEAQNEVPFHPSDFGKLRPSIFMPRWVSRITLEITMVRIERLHDIGPADCVCEGYKSPIGTRYAQEELNALDWYRDIWESINGPGSWDLNPWVWVIEFKRVPS